MCGIFGDYTNSDFYAPFVDDYTNSEHHAQFVGPDSEKFEIRAGDAEISMVTNVCCNFSNSRMCQIY